MQNQNHEVIIKIESVMKILKDVAPKLDFHERKRAAYYLDSLFTEYLYEYFMK